MACRVHVIPHMHWDREWYFTTEESRILLVNNMAEILNRLETDPDYPHFLLDGQTAILEDYFAVKPADRPRVTALVQQGKLLIGPWYTQTDELVVGGESILRNLYYGLKDCKEFGDAMMIGYLPDSFGQSEKLPQILNSFGIKRALFWRGASERHGTTKHSFYWQGNHAGQVLAHLLPSGYAIGKYLPDDDKALQTRMDKYLPVLERGAVGDDIVLPNGHDQMPIQQNIYNVLDRLHTLYPDKKFTLSRYETLFEALEQTPDLDTIQGELLDGKYMRVHRSIFSTRADIKSANTRIENKLTNHLEPLASIAHRLGFDYQHGLIEQIWKEILKNHAHDSIGCCCSDKVHRQIADRFFLAEDKLDSLIQFYKRKIADAIPSDRCLDKLVVFNLLPYPRTTVIQASIVTKMKRFTLHDEAGNQYPFTVLHSEEIDAGLIDRQIVHYGDYDPFVRYDLSIVDTLPAMGYKSYLIEQNGSTVTPHAPRIATSAENEFYHIKVNKNGSFTLVDKQNRRTYHDILTFQDGSDDGDEYDYSPLADDFVITSEHATADTLVKIYPHHAELISHLRLAVPKNLASRRQKICDGTLDLTLTMTLSQQEKILPITVAVDNQVRDHRLRLLLPNDLPITHSIADNQFGNIKRPVVDDAMAVWQQEQWDERPDAIYPMLSYVTVDHPESLAMLTNSVREYELIGQNFGTIAITLLRGVGVLGKENLLRRPGRPSGIKLETPDSQLIGKHRFSLALTKNSDTIGVDAKQFLTPPICYNKMPHDAMKLNPVPFRTPYQYSMLSLADPSVILSALKKAEDQDGYILRAFQTTHDKTSPMLSGAQILAQTDSNERPISSATQITLPNNTVQSYLVL